MLRSRSIWFNLSLFLVFILIKYSTSAPNIRSPTKEFNRYSLVQPVVQHARTKREITTTKYSKGMHQPEVMIVINIDGKEYIIDLKLNKDLVSHDHIISYQKDGETVLHKPNKEELDLCQYYGKMRNVEDSWVAVSTCHGIRGIIYDGKKTRYIEPVEGDEIGTTHYVYDHSDLKTMYPNTKYGDQDNTALNRYRRDVKQNDTKLRGPFNANQLSRYVEMVLVVDNSEFKANGENINVVHRQMKDITNIVNSLFAPLNVFITLVGVVIWTEEDKIDIEQDGQKMLRNFLRYRRTRLVFDIPNDAAYFLTHQKFNDGSVGKALKGVMCTTEYSGGVASSFSEFIGLYAHIIAHSMGHNFGMDHDENENCVCPDEKCIMSSSFGFNSTHWSNCSIEYLKKSFQHGMDYCLRNKPLRIFDFPTCGNGFVEPEEQCDCGLDRNSACVACCDPDSCLLRSNATCAVGECCDTQTCRPKNAGNLCRSTGGNECDLPEYCTGNSEFCPDDVYKMDTTPCSNNKALCVKGSCRSHKQQCQLLWGPTGNMSSEVCYKKMNIKGKSNGHCGYQRGDEKVYHECAEEDALCGLLHCVHSNDRLMFGMESGAILKAVFLSNNGTINECRTAFIDLGLSDIDPGMVPDGAKCGEEKMCLKQKCVPVASVREQIVKQNTSICPSECSGHGVCNSKGHCHCFPGFSPPLCTPIFWGSINSGPANGTDIMSKTSYW